MPEVSVNSSPVQALDIGVYQEGNEIVINLARAVPEGVARGVKLVKETVCDRKKAKFDEDFLKELNKRIIFYLPAVAGEYRGEGEVSVLVGRAKCNGQWKMEKYLLPAGLELRNKMYWYGMWLEEKTKELKEEKFVNDLVKALELACEASYGLTSPQLHPFRDGNGRTARLLANTILMINAHEVAVYGKAVLPVPNFRPGIGSQTGEHERDHYLEALSKVGMLRDLNPYILYMTTLCRNNLLAMVNDYETGVKSGKIKKLAKNETPGLIEKFERRIDILQELTLSLDPNKNPQPHLIPDYRPKRAVRAF